MTKEKLLSKSQLEEFQQNGHLLLKHILDPIQCHQFDTQHVQPALLNYAGIHPNDSSTWNTDRLKPMATGDYIPQAQAQPQPSVLPGVMVRKEDGSDPIPNEHSLDLSPLHPILDQLHGSSNDWEWLHHNVGWIHVRFPISGRRNQQAKDIPTSWHIDGGHYTPHYIDSPEQSVIVLPMIRDVRVGGGNTLLLSKSHIYMAQKLAQAGTDGIPREKTQNANDVAQFWPEHWIVEMAPCEAGDVLLLHPFLVHAAGQAREGHPLRIAFNMGVKWKRKPIIDVHVDVDVDVDVEEDTSKQHPIGWLEKSIIWALQQTLDL